MREERTPISLRARTRLPKPSLFAAGAFALLIAEAGAALILTVDHRHEVLGGDGPEYVRYAKNLLEHGSFSAQEAPPYDPNVGRTPGYPVFLAALRLVGGDSILLVRLVQFVLLGLIAVAVYKIAIRVGDRREARVAAVFVLSYLPLVWMARYHLSELLATALAAVVVLLLMPTAEAEHRFSRCAAAGVVLGLAALVRPSFALLVLPLALLLTVGKDGHWRHRWKLAATLAIVFGVTLTPWMVRNVVTADAFIPLGAQSGLSLYASANQYAGRVSPAFTELEWTRFRARSKRVAAAVIAKEKRRPSEVPLSVRIDLASDRAYRSEARSIMQDVGAGEILKRLPRRVAYLWAPSDAPPRATYDFWHRVAQVQNVVLALCGLLGLIVLARRRIPWHQLWPLVILAAYLSALHLVFHVEGRYTLPARPMLLAISAIGAVAMFNRLLQARRPA